MAEVLVRHTCDGNPVGTDRVERRMVWKDRHGHYFVKLWTRRFPVERVGDEPRFILTFRGRTEDDD